MNAEQTTWIANMNARRAAALIAKYDESPEAAADAGADTYEAFMAAWDMIHPGTYWQHQSMSYGVSYHLINMRDNPDD